MRRLLSWLWQRLTVERLAVAVFLVVAVGLWWGMQSRPEWVNTFPSGMGDSYGELSPDGTLYLVTEFSPGAFHSLPGDCWPVDNRRFQKQRLRVIDLATGREIWHWEVGLTEIQEVNWTQQNRLCFLHSTLKPMTFLYRNYRLPFFALNGELLCIDPRARPAEVYRQPFPLLGPYHQLDVDEVGNSLALKQTAMDTQWARVDLGDLRTGVLKPFLLTGSDDWTVPVVLSPDGALVLSRKRLENGSALLLHDVKTGKLLHQFLCRSKVEKQFSIAFSPDSRLLAASDDAEGFRDCVHVWDLHTGQLLATLAGFRSELPERWINNKPCFTGVYEVRFLADGSRLAVTTGNVEKIFHPDSFEHVQLHLFDARSFQRLHTTESAIYPTPSPDGRFLSLVRDQPANYGVAIHDLRDHREIFSPRKIDENCRIGFVDTSQEGTLHYTLKIRWEPPADNGPGWLNWLRQKLGWSNVGTVHYDLSFRHLPDGRLLDRWHFHAEHLTATPIPGRDQMLLHFCRVNGQRDRLELYSLPPRRPWFHILGGALAAGITVELLGLGKRWGRRKKASVNSVGLIGA